MKPDLKVYPEIHKTPLTTRIKRQGHAFQNEVHDSTKLRLQEIDFLKSLAESGQKIPKEKINLFKLLVLKEDPLKIGEQMLKKNVYFKDPGIFDTIAQSKVK